MKIFVSTQVALACSSLPELGDNQLTPASSRLFWQISAAHAGSVSTIWPGKGVAQVTTGWRAQEELQSKELVSACLFVSVRFSLSLSQSHFLFNPYFASNSRSRFRPLTICHSFLLVVFGEANDCLGEKREWCILMSMTIHTPTHGPRSWPHPFLSALHTYHTDPSVHSNHICPLFSTRMQIHTNLPSQFYHLLYIYIYIHHLSSLILT